MGVGTAITLAIADGSKTEGELADVYYHDSWTDGFFSRLAKLEWLDRRADVGTQPDAVVVNRDLLDDMRPEPFQNGDWVRLRDCFVFASSGLESKRDHVVYGVSREKLEQQVRGILSLEDVVRDRIEDCDGGIAQPLGREIIAQGAIERADHVPYNLDRRVIDAIALAGLRA